VPDSGEEAGNEENGALERHRWSEAQAKYFVPMATSKFLQLVTSGCEWNQ
jgi:hypothetical protein